MEIQELLENALKIKSGESEVYISSYKKHSVFIKKFAYSEKRLKQIELEKEIVNFLNSKSFQTYKIIGTDLYNNHLYIIYETLSGTNGFKTNRDINYFYNVGLMIGRFHNLMQEFSITDFRSELGLLHGDLHSGNLVIENNQIFLIDFSSAQKGFYFEDLLNIEYELKSESDYSEKSFRFIEGYKQYNQIHVPGLEKVIEKIIDNDQSELLILKLRSQTHSNYYSRLEDTIRKGEPTFIPSWAFV